MNCQEIGALLDLSKRTVERHWRYAMGELRLRLSDGGRRLAFVQDGSRDGHNERTPGTRSVQEIFIELIDLPEAERTATLRERCGGDAQLESHVRKLLDADAEDERNETFSGPVADIGAGPTPLRVGNYVVRAIVLGGAPAADGRVHAHINSRCSGTSWPRRTRSMTCIRPSLRAAGGS